MSNTRCRHGIDQIYLQVCRHFLDGIGLMAQVSAQEILTTR